MSYEAFSLAEIFVGNLVTSRAGDTVGGKNVGFGVVLADRKVGENLSF
jgi:hypothetical protein